MAILVPGGSPKHRIIKTIASLGKNCLGKIQFVDLYFQNVKIIRLGVVVSYIGLNQKWSVDRVEATSDHIIVDRKFFTSFCA